MNRFLVLLSLVLSLFATPVLAQTTTISRLQLAHPDLGFPGGATLHTAIADLYTKVGDNINTRYQEYTGVANSATRTFFHNLGSPFADTLVILYSGVGTSKTRIADPAGAGWVIAATSGFVTTKVDVTAPSSGGPFSFTVELTDGLKGMAVQSPAAVAITGGSITGITDLLVLDGGTGSSTAAGARTNLGAAASGANSDITSITGLTTPLTAPQGGTGVNNAGTLTYGSSNVTLTTSGTTGVTLPTSGTLATLAGTETLTNKTLGTTNTFTAREDRFSVVDSGDATKTILFNPGGTTATSTTLTAAQTASRVITFPDATTTVVGTDTTQTLTGKTLSGNTATNLISGSGTLTLNTTGTVTVPNATDTLVGKATTDTLTNKTISGASNTLSNISLTGSVTGTLPTGNGGTNKATWTSGSIPYLSSTTAFNEDNANLSWDGTNHKIVLGPSAGLTDASGAYQMIGGGIVNKAGATFGSISGLAQFDLYANAYDTATATRYASTAGSSAGYTLLNLKAAASGTTKVMTLGASTSASTADASVSATTEAFSVTAAGTGVFATGVQLPTSGGTATTLDYYETDDAETSTFTPNGTGSNQGTATPPTGGANSGTITFGLTRVGRVVTLRIPTVTATAGTTTTNMKSNTALPSRFRPSSNMQFNCTVEQADTDLATPGKISISNAGVISIFKDGTEGSSFTVTAHMGTDLACLISYTN